MMRKQVVESGCASAGMVPLPAPIHRILGATLGSDSVAYVLHEDEGFDSVPDADLMFEPMVTRLRLGPQGWRIVPSRSMLSRSNSFVTSVTCDSTQKKRR
jgi:hypothetical protein